MIIFTIVSAVWINLGIIAFVRLRRQNKIMIERIIELKKTLDANGIYL